MTFWLLLTIAVLAWYGGVTAYVAFKGVFDIRGMLKLLEERKREEDPS